MTSQKRYRHHQDSSHGNTRFRDIPPRFKRQKSSSSPTRVPTPPDDSQANLNSKTTDTREVKLSQSTSPVPTAVTSSSYEFEEKHAGQIRPLTDIQPTAQTVMSSAATWNWQQETDRAYAQSLWDNPYHTNMGFHEHSHVSLGTHFGYKTNSLPLSPWASESANLPGNYGSMWTPEPNNSVANQRVHYSPRYLNENTVPHQNFIPQQSPRVDWGMSAASLQHYPTSSSPTVKSSKLPLPNKVVEKVKSSKDVERKSDSRVIDYTDPDVRTIEMLRELERVADQKESENDGFGTDRKSLVSHHLRMLMCAVDRYTEGIEDELAMSSRHDEVAPSSDSRGSTPGVSPAPSKMWANEQSNNIVGDKPELDIVPWSPKDTMSPVWNEVASPVNSHTAASIQNHEPLLPTSSQASALMDGQQGGQQMAAWDLWSSQTFDFCDFLMNQNSGDSTFQAPKERKPLYQRQTLNF